MAAAIGTRVTSTAGHVTAIRNEENLQRSLVNASRVANVCEDYRGRETLVLDMTQLTPLFDYFVITTGNSRRQMHAIAETADDVMEDHGTQRLAREGFDGPWICQDYGDVVLHVFMPEARDLYDLENLWGDAPRIDWKAVLENSETE